MTVIELIEMLNDMPEDAEVRMASQPSWPMQATLEYPVLVRDCEVEGPFGTAEVVYLGEGRPLGYLPRPAATELGWR